MKNNIIWIINQYATTPDTGIGGRHYYLSKALLKRGYKVYVVSAGYTHLHRHSPEIIGSHKVEDVEGIKYVWVDMPIYGDAHSNKRIINWFLFAWKLLKLNKWLPEKPGAILYSSPSLVGFLSAYKLSKSLKASLIFEVRDIWPLSLCELGGFSTKHPFIKFMQWIEDFAYSKSDFVISNLKNSVSHMELRGLDSRKFTWIPNGYCENEITCTEPLPEAVQGLIPKDKFIVGYTGTVGIANALDEFIDAAQILKKNTKVQFVLVGAGREKERLVQRVIDLSLNNVTFIDSIPKVQVQSMLACFDICFIGWKDEPLYRFGIAANKIFDYLRAGKPILHAFSGACDPIEEYNAGITVPAGNAVAIANGIVQLCATESDELLKMGESGRRACIKYHEFNQLGAVLDNVVTGKKL